jgi:hypothetical protein
MGPDQQPADSPTQPVYQSIGDRARWARWLLVAAVVVDVVAVVSGLLERSLLSRLVAGEELAADEASSSDTRQGVIGALQLGLLIVNAVTFLRWLSLAYRNLPALGVRRLRYKTWWVIGGWVIPILWWFRPKQIVNDVWRGSDPLASPVHGVDWTERAVPGLLGGWWIMWLVTGALGNIAYRMSLGTGESAAALQGVNTVLLLSDATSAVAGVLAVLVVDRLTARQEKRARQLATSPAAASGPGEG